MATRILERPKAVKRLAGVTVPGAYPLKWVAILVLTDIALFVIASNLGALIGFHRWNSPRIVRNLFLAEILYVALWLFIFDRLGLYRRTYALSMKDELYYTVAALMLGTIPQLVLFTIYPGISTSRIALIFALIFSIVLVGTSRAAFHRLRQSSRLRGSRRISLVGSAETIAEVLESLELGDDSHAQTIVVEDLAQ